MMFNKSSKFLNFQYFKNDLPAGIVVFLVALPLCLGIALASGTPLFSGIISGVVGGTVVALASGSQLSISGPTASLTVIVIAAMQQLGSYEALLLAVIIAGIIQIIMGFLKAGIIGYYFPSSVIKGMMAAIGIILILKQFPHAIGYDKDSEGDFEFFQTDGENTFSELFHSVNYLQPGAIIISLVALLILVIWDVQKLKKFAVIRLMPGALVVVISGVALNELFELWAPNWALVGEELVSLPVSASANDFFKHFVLPDFSAINNPAVYTSALSIAIIASLEALLSIEAADKMDPLRRITPVNRELKAQGIGNIVAGLVGGLPITAVVVRSMANISAGGKTRMASLVHGLLLLGSVLVFATILNKIPLACLAAILLMLGYKLTRISLVKSMYKLGWEQFVPFMVTIVATQFSDLLKGVAAGMLVAAFYILRNNYRAAFKLNTIPVAADAPRMIIQLAEDVSFLNKASIANQLNELGNNVSVVIDGSHTRTIHIDVIELIHNFKNGVAPDKNIQVDLIKIPEMGTTELR